ncbi:hypothetical protein O3645_07455 [Pauljensenia sp. 27098_8_107]|jgi:hypothetical protein
MKMTTTPPASWAGNLFRRPPLGVYTVTGSPEDAVMRCLDLWVTIGVREHAHGMPQQFARRGWVGTEITVDASSTATKMPSLDLPEVMSAVSGAGMLLHIAYKETAPEGLRAVTDTVGEVAGLVGSAAREAAGGVVDTVGEVASGVVDTVVEATGTVGEVVGFVGSAAYAGASSAANKVGGFVSGFASKTWRKERLPKPGKCRIVVAARSLPDQEKEAAQLWCFISDDSPKRSLGSDDQIDEAFQWLERKLTEQNLLLDVPHYVNQKDLPADSALTANCLAVMRQAASTEPLS